MLFSLKSLFSEIWSLMNSDWPLGPGASPLREAAVTRWVQPYSKIVQRN